MTTTTTHRLNAVSKGFVLAAMLASASALAEMPANAVAEGDGHRADAAIARTEAADSGHALPRKKADLGASRTAPPARVYLEDFERVHKRVNRQHPTKMYWIGKGPQAK